MMHVSILLIPVLSLYSASGNFVVCGKSSNCILLTECPEMLNVLKAGRAESKQRVRESLCGYEMKQLPKVCCHHEGKPTEATQPSDPALSAGSPFHAVILPSVVPQPPTEPHLPTAPKLPTKPKLPTVPPPPPIIPTPPAVPLPPPAPPVLPVPVVPSPPAVPLPPPAHSPSALPNGDSILPKICGKPMIDTKIVGGTVAPIGAYPWMAALGYIDMKKPGGDSRGVQFLCAGSLISSRYVLTAAHCLNSEGLEGKLLSVIHLGDWDISTDVDCQVTPVGVKKCSPPHIVAGIEEKVLHPLFNSRAESSDDIALVRLNISVSFETTKANIRPLCLPPKGFNPKAAANGRLPVAAGWGFTEHGNQSDILLRVAIPFADDELCRVIYDERFLEGEQLCVGGSSKEDTCSGDSGAPLILQGPHGPPYLQIGIVAYGSLPCAISQVPGVYTSVSEYSDWIKANLKP